METLSTSISTFIIPKSTIKNHLPLHHHRRRPSLSSATAPSSKTTTFTTRTNSLPPHINYSSRPPSPLKHSANPHPHHKSASTGYAVALLDAARRHNAVDAIRRDVEKLSRWLRDDQLRRAMADPSTDEAANGGIVKEVVKRGGFEKHLVRLVKMLAEKAKVDLISQVLSEFGRICDEVIGFEVVKNDQVVVLPPGVKMEEDQILEIVGRIRKLTGAATVTQPHAGGYLGCDLRCFQSNQRRRKRLDLEEYSH